MPAIALLVVLPVTVVSVAIGATCITALSGNISITFERRKEGRVS